VGQSDGGEISSSCLDRLSSEDSLAAMAEAEGALGF